MGKSIASRFENIAIEKSMLLGVITNDDELTLEMDFCLEPSHPEYEEPGDGGECWHPGLLRFGGITKLEIDRSAARDSEERQRRFAIQSFNIQGTKFDMSCDWGDIHLQARSIRVLTE